MYHAQHHCGIGKTEPLYTRTAAETDASSMQIVAMSLTTKIILVVTAPLILHFVVLPALILQLNSG